MRHPRDSRSLTLLAVIGALALALIVAVWVGAFERIRAEREQAMAAEVAKNDNLAIAHEERTARSFEVVDTLLRFVRADHLQAGSSLGLAERLSTMGADARFANAIAVIGPRGEVLATTVENPPESNFADRQYFRHHAGHPADELLIGPPIVGRLTGRPAISLTRRITQPDGGFGGVVYLALDPNFFSALYERSNVGASGSLALIGLDGITRVRRNGDRLSYGEDVRQSQLFKELQRAGAGHYVARAASDGVLRAVSYRKLDDYPLVVVVASSLHELQAAAVPRERATLGTAFVATLLVLTLAVVLGLVSVRRLRTMAAIEDSERRYRLLFEHSLDAILRTRPDGTVLAANAAACRLFDASETGLRETRRAELFAADDARGPALMASLEQTGRARGTLGLRRADGSRFEAEVSANLYRDGDGQPVASLIVRDLTERVAAEADRLKLEAQLRESQKLESVGTLAGGIAHDFNNILAAILANAAIARQDLSAGQLSADVLDRIAQAASRGRALVQQILTFSRRAPEQRQVHAVQPLLEEALALLRATLPSTVRLAVTMPAEPLTVLTDATQLQQVVMNLCTNAWQALPGHKGSVRVSVAALPPDAGDAAPQAWMRLRVEDDGVGMSAETQARLFEPFFTTKPVGQGTGLGLSVVHGIVASHGGRVEVHSVPGQGATFDVLLPLAGAAVPVSGGPREAFVRGHGERLLYVDDDEVLRITVENLLRRLGYRVTTCADAAAVLRLVGDDSAGYALVVTDYNMPETTGLDLAAQLLQIRPDLPIVVSSGYVSEDMQQRASALGVRRVMMKEYTLEQLGPIVAGILADEREAQPAAEA